MGQEPSNSQKGGSMSYHTFTATGPENDLPEIGGRVRVMHADGSGGVCGGTVRTMNPWPFRSGCDRTRMPVMLRGRNGGDVAWTVDADGPARGGKRLDWTPEAYLRQA